MLLALAGCIRAGRDHEGLRRVVGIGHHLRPALVGAVVEVEHHPRVAVAAGRRHTRPVRAEAEFVEVQSRRAERADPVRHAQAIKGEVEAGESDAVGRFRRAEVGRVAPDGRQLLDGGMQRIQREHMQRPNPVGVVCW